ncbi:Group 4 capsule polysaccharide lipoprotein gfcB, YjbF [Poseidonocella pacifica]|uniref:Group 4 capsule polysaccharide lipoprotein gfcB, YjbF n=1 Tax=Poseidonocella pacifica TaxID=871651 RepID=A0A1I0XWW7_9RHOB|nr:YjbF family lipoprotein [Poseidonocella pacifica]SFB04443.1 Group 4 capsule polysaccharide lipoprotein gfcB, YjbF [Poseidonocella pacifica]
MKKILVLAVLLAGCSNDPFTTPRAKTAFDTLRSVLRKSPPATQPSAETVLASTQGPLVVVRAGSTGAATYLLRISERDGFDTYTSSDRRTITLRNGMIEETRGLGNDMMSTRLEDSASLILTRRAGTSTREYSHLTGEGVTETLRLMCEISVDGSSVTEACSGPAEITNSYVVAPDGYVVSSRQWVSPGVGYIAVQQLRR